MLSKKDQTKSNRIKPQAFKDKAYLSWLHEVKQPPCFVCGIHLGIQIHHVKETSSDLRNDNECIPLCYEHHLGLELSPHGSPVAFRYTFPIWEQLEFAEELYNEYNQQKL